ncbi:MAG TPA: NADH-ubiquinone oxidoreductase-F iron-sulfur binding region domain-containing protein [Candidatus Eisenbacteria bacterium]|nr:NADH-ubiquinone oxidoreductase-F iron-sulfur binding region domain-containing protein [Candidatus Eisenbacteria bacterium]
MKGILFPRGIAEGRESLEQYRARLGYRGLVEAVKRPPEEVIQTVADAGLRGRGGAAFPTAKKWALTRETGAPVRYLVMNGGEDEPGSKKDRLLLETVPHLVLEGVILAAYAVGASKAYLYINANYDAAIESAAGALAEAKQAGYWGPNVLGSEFSLEIEIVKAPHNYVAGEDTAVLEVIEGKRAWPRQKPPYPVTVGLFGKPTTVNNVETLANVGPIMARGASWYRTFGTPDSPGTMVFSLNEEVKRPGAYELPFGTPLRTLIENCGGGTRDGKKIKAIMPASPSCAFLPAEKIDTPLDHASMREAGAALGCGVVRLVTEGACMVEETLEILEFFMAESCGQCPACRMETSTLVALLKKLQQGQGGPALVQQFDKIIEFNKGKGFCNLIAMPGPPLRSALKLFPGDFEAHLTTGKCSPS